VVVAWGGAGTYVRSLRGFASSSLEGILAFRYYDWTVEVKTYWILAVSAMVNV
jgi:hypothetical protein